MSEMSDMLALFLYFFVVLQMLASSDAQAGPSNPDQTFQCPNAGYFCATIKPRAYGMTSYALQSPISPLVSFASPDPSRGGGGDGGGGRQDEIAKFYACSSSNTRSVSIAQCPQNACVQGYCAGGGPATVPRQLRDGNGLYCGRTIIDQIGRGRRTQDTESPAKGGGGAVGGGGGGGGAGDGSYDEYVSDNLYYFSGSQGINLGPCSGRCVSAGQGQADYCEAPAGLRG